MDRPIWKNNCTPAFIEMTRKFVTEKIARKLAGIRKTHGMLPGLAVPDEDFMDIDIDEDVPGKAIDYFRMCFFKSLISFSVIDATKAVVRNLFIITENQLYRYLEVCLSKYLKAKIEPGEFLLC